MSGINFHTKEISVKIVYYGPGLCGKTTTLQNIYNSLPESRRQRFVSLATEVDRTIFFDFLPVTAYRIRDFLVRLQLYTVPGQVFYNATRKLVLNGVDGVVFVADSQRAMQDSNLESLQNLEENLEDLGIELKNLPMIIQANKRDLDDIHSLEEMDQLYNNLKVPFFGTVATAGEGVLDGLKTISQLVVNALIRKGLGAQLKKEAEKPAEPEAPVEPSESIAGTIASMQVGPGKARKPPGPIPVVQSSDQASVTKLVKAASGWWPAGQISELGSKIEQAIREERWADVIVVVQALVKYQAERWAASNRITQDDPIPAFLLLRGVKSAHYRSLVNAIEAVQNKRPEAVGRGDAMAGLVLALSAVW